MNTLLNLENTERILQEYAERLVSDYKDELIKSDRVATKNLINSIKYIYTKDNNSYEISLSLEDYWKYVEWDTKPHFPPINKILEWVKAKPVLPVEYNGKLPTEKQLAFLIARKISEVGTEGSHDLENTLDVLNKEYEEKIEEAITKDIDRSIGLVLVNYFK